MRSSFHAGLLLLSSIIASAQQTANGDPIYAVGGKGLKPPQAVQTPAPHQALDVKKAKYEGVATFSGYFGKDGNYHDAKILRSIGDKNLDNKALEAVAKWKFSPAVKDGKP